MRTGPISRRLVQVVAATALVAGAAGVAGAAAAGPGDHPRRVQAPGGPAVAGRRAVGSTPVGSTPAEFTSTANPTSLDPPVATPPTRPTVVTIADHAAFGNAPPPATSTVTLPTGRWAQVVLDVTGSEQGRQYDRLLDIFDGPTQIFLGVTPEPTPAGITWHVQKDVTGYLPLLTGTRTFSTSIDNYLSSVDNGVPVVTARLLFYPATRGWAPVRSAGPTNPALAGDAIEQAGPASPPQRPTVPDQIVPLLPSGATTTFNEINTGQTETATVTLPHDVTTATLDLYALGQIGDEFWFGLQPGFREIEVSIDGRPAGVVWPFPYVYTGGVNPLIWRPVTGLHTLDVPSYRLDLSPFAGLLGGTHTISITVANNAGYWLAGGSLLITDGRGRTTGRLVTDTLQFPTVSQTTTADALGSATQPVTSEAARRTYDIAGTVTEGRRTWTDDLRSSLQFGDDQSNIDPSCTGPSCYQWVHAEETADTTAVSAGTARRDRSTWTVDAPNGYLQANGGSDFFLPASVSQELTALDTQRGPWAAGYRTELTEAVIGYGALEEDSSAPTITNGETTGTVAWDTSAGMSYRRTVLARGGVIEQDLVTGR